MTPHSSYANDTVVQLKPRNQQACESVRGAIPGFDRNQSAQIFAALTSAGYGMAAMCCLLALGTEKLHELLIDFNVPTPKDDLQKQAKIAKAWSPHHALLLVKGWMFNWRAGYIAEQVGRSKGSVYAKARRLCLPKRDRRSLHVPEKKPDQPDTIAPEVSGALIKKLSSTTKCNAPSDANNEWRIKNTITPVVIRSKRNGREIDWTREVVELAIKRRFAGHTTKEIAADFGIREKSLGSRFFWLSVPRLAEIKGPRLSAHDAETIDLRKFGYRIQPRALRQDRFYLQNLKTYNRSREDMRMKEYNAAA